MDATVRACSLLHWRETKARRGEGECGRLSEVAEVITKKRKRHESGDNHGQHGSWYSLRGAKLAGAAGRSPPFLSRERAAVSVDVDPERCSPGYHETCLALETVQESRVAAGKRCSVWWWRLISAR